MHTEHLHRTLSPQAYARLQDDIRQQAESEHRQAVQTFFHALLVDWPHRLLQTVAGVRHPAARTRVIEAA
ncbi:hypothetical protein J2W49_001664 [Hydrogenophaga palleronii]|uniref:Uncharacterized protein n=1 Tax=Hydrogenophaga palleronii TaxID=65655 RepID=A0ABU1WKY2_9BURK|nr:hypothetical protein [Hydrogenophaga palleronii]MDR7149709.1 hypothetical protein [Hydrogenophaga palleronii]